MLGRENVKKSDNYYFKNFVICAEYGEEAARMLERNLKEFDVTHLSERLDESMESNMPQIRKSMRCWRPW